MVRAEIKSMRSHGLEVWKVYVAGQYLTEFLSQELAESKAATINRALGVKDESQK